MVKVLDHKVELEKYMGNKNGYTPLLNIFFNDPSDTDWYATFGTSILFAYSPQSLPEELKGYSKKINSFNFFDRLLGKERKTLSRLAIYYVTAYLGPRILKDTFGEPLYHNEFGEGFDNPNLDNNGYASYFIRINDSYNVHIGYDHRGTGIEFEGNENKRTQPKAEEVLTLLQEILWHVKIRAIIRSNK